jgi:hypothetical protein
MINKVSMRQRAAAYVAYNSNVRQRLPRITKLAFKLYPYSQDLQLPYDFDMLWNIKNSTQLVKYYLQCKNDVKDIEDVCKSHNLNIDDLIKTTKID